MCAAFSPQVSLLAKGVADWLWNCCFVGRCAVIARHSSILPTGLLSYLSAMKPIKKNNIVKILEEQNRRKCDVLLFLRAIRYCRYGQCLLLSAFARPASAQIWFPLFHRRSFRFKWSWLSTLPTVLPAGGLVSTAKLFQSFLKRTMTMSSGKKLCRDNYTVHTFQFRVLKQ